MRYKDQHRCNVKACELKLEHNQYTDCVCVEWRSQDEVYSGTPF